MLTPRLIPIAAALSAVLTTAGCTTIGKVNEQNWSQADRQAWYRGSQGSRLIPYSWLMALKDADGQPLMRPETIDRYRYLRPGQGENTPLPIGFAIDDNRNSVKLGVTDVRWFKGQDQHEPWVGMNCAACHTAELSFNDSPIRVDGGPTMADFEGFTDALQAAVDATADDPARWADFAAAALGPQPKAGPFPQGRALLDTPANRAGLRTAFDAFRVRLDELAAISKPEPGDPQYGPGRVDAVGHILARVAWLANGKDQFRIPASAPVSYPFLWNIPQHKLLQWNGIAPNQPITIGGKTAIDAGALVRNVSEVIGVFADVDIVPRSGAPKLDGYPSSIDITNLAAMERQLERLKPPKWPAGAPFDPALAKVGEGLFVTKHCNECHTVLLRDDLKSPAGEVMTPVFGGVNTDPWMACNAYSFKALSGKLAGSYPRYFKTQGAPDPLRPIAETRSLLVVTSIGTLAGKKWQLVEATATGLFDPYKRPVVPFVPTEQEDKKTRLEECKAAWASSDAQAPDRKLLQYKGRPLGGIWATGPYLHNGSVRTLDELLMKPSLRATSFRIGSRKLDTKGVGYVDEAVPGGWTFLVKNAAGHDIDGNSNLGHDYGNASITPEQRAALVEYMKSL